MNLGTIIAFVMWLIPFYVLYNLACLAWIIYVRMATQAVQGWPSTPGKIVSSRLARSSSYDRGSVPFAFVTYRYTVQGKDYKSVTVAPGGAVNNEAVATSIVARYPAGAEVSVFYNPADPAKAFLEKGSAAQQRRAWGILIGGNLVLWILMPAARWLANLLGMKW